MFRCYLRQFWRFLYRRSHGYRTIKPVPGKSPLTKHALVHGWISDHPRSAME